MKADNDRGLKEKRAAHYRMNEGERMRQWKLAHVNDDDDDDDDDDADADADGAAASGAPSGGGRGGGGDAGDAGDAGGGALVAEPVHHSPTRPERRKRDDDMDMAT